MSFLGAVNNFAENVGGSLGLTKNASRNALLGLATGGVGGALIGMAAGPVANFFTGADAKNAANDAAKEAQKVRRRSVVRQLEEKQQADSIAMSGLRNNSSNSASQQAPGFIGSNLQTTAGTF